MGWEELTMYQPKSQDGGLVQENNRVSLPAVYNFTETYPSLLDGMWPGFTAELEKIEAVLVKNGNTERAENLVMQAAASLTHDDTPATGSGLVAGHNKKGSKNLYIQEASVDENAWVGREIYITGHPAPYLIVSNDASAATTNLVRLQLNVPLVKDVEITTDLTIQRNIFVEPVVGTTSAAKALGITFATVPPNHWYWLVYRGLINKDMGSIAAGSYLVKGDAGIVAALTIDQTPTADIAWNREILGRHRGDNLVELDIRGIAA